MDEVTRQRKRAQNRSERKQLEQAKHYFNSAATKGELLTVGKNVKDLITAFEGLCELLFEKGTLTKEELEATVVKIIQERKRVEAIAKESSWTKKFEMCAEHGIDNRSLIEGLMANPKEVSEEEFKYLKSIYFPDKQGPFEEVLAAADAALEKETVRGKVSFTNHPEILQEKGSVEETDE